METKETILAKLNTSPDRLTELVEQDGFYFVRKEITREQYPVIKQFYEYQQRSPSPAIVTIYSVYEKEGHFYINEEWIRGESVEEHLYLQGPFSKDEVIRYAMDLCQGLQWFHKHNMIHRDVTPANVIISEEKKAYLVDPGILREVKKNQTNDTQILGTPGYAAPVYAIRRSDRHLRTRCTHQSDDNRKNAKRGASKRQTSAKNCNQVHTDFCQKTIFKLSSDLQTTRCRFTGRHPC